MEGETSTLALPHVITDRQWRGIALDGLVGIAVVIHLAWARLETRYRRPKDWELTREISPGWRGDRSSTRLQRAVLRRIQWMVPVLARKVPWRAVCLEHALAARRILRWAGVPAQLRLGVAMNGEDFAAHAWLEVNGRVVVGGAQTRRFKAFEADP